MADEQIIVSIKVEKDEIDSAKKSIDNLTQSVEELSTRITNAKKQNNEYKQAQKELNAEYNSGKITTEKYEKEIDSLNKKIQTNNKIIAEDSVQLRKNRSELQANINLVQNEGKTYDALSAKLNLARKNAKDLAVQFGINSKEFKNATSNIILLDNKLKQIDSTLGQHTRKVGDYEGALKSATNELIGAAGFTIGIAGAVSALKSFNETSNILIKLTGKVENMFGLTGDAAKSLSSDILAISKSFDEDYNEILIAANTVSKELGISANEALLKIEEGFQKGSNNSGQFLDILKEYPTQFKAAGIDAETMFAIINQQVKQGIYSDKGVDAIKEAGLRLRENTKAVQEALAPLDATIKAQIKQEIAAGNSFKAIQLVSKALNDTSLTAEETQKIIADVFGGPGEDAGLAYLQTLKDIDSSLSDVEKQTSLVEDSQLNLSKTYNNFVQSVEDSSGVISKAWSSILDSAAEYLNELITINDENATTIERMDALKNVLSKVNPFLTFFNEKMGKIVNWFIKLNPGIEEAILRLRKLFGMANGPGEPILTVLDPGKEKKSLEQINDITDEIEKKNKDKKTKTKKEEKYDPSKDPEIQKWLERNKAANEQRKFEEQMLSEIDKLESDQAQKAIELEQQKWDAEIEFAQKQQDLRDEQAKKEIEKEKEKQQAIADIRNTFIDEAENYASDLISMKSDEKLERLKEEADAQEEILKNKLDKGLITEEEYNQKSSDLKKKVRIDEAKADKKKALFDIAISTAVGIVKAIPNLVLMAVAAAQGAIQAAFVAARPIPSFGKGVNDIVSIGGSHASGHDVDIWGYSGNQKQYFGKVERGEAMPVIRKSAANDYLIAKLNGYFNSNNNRTFATGTNDITNQQTNGISIDNLMDAFSNVQIVAKIEDITKEAGKKMQIVNNSKV